MNTYALRINALLKPTASYIKKPVRPSWRNLSGTVERAVNHKASATPSATSVREACAKAREPLAHGRVCVG